MLHVGALRRVVLHSEELCYTQKRHLRGLRKPTGSRNNRTTLLFQDDDDNDDDNDMIHKLAVQKQLIDC